MMFPCTHYMLTLGLYAGDDVAPTLFTGQVKARDVSTLGQLMHEMVVEMQAYARGRYGRAIDPMWQFWSCSPSPDCK